MVHISKCKMMIAKTVKKNAAGIEAKIVELQSSFHQENTAV